MNSCELLPWDTDFFGFRIGRVLGHTLIPEQATQIDRWCQSNGIRALYFLASPDDPATTQTAEQNGFHLVDIRVTLELQAAYRSPVQEPEAATKIRPGQTEDLPALQAMARCVHQETRFFADTHFDPQRAKDLYATWIELEFRGGTRQVLVAEDVSARPVGYISCHLNESDKHGQIGLLGVGSTARGQGIGQSLVLAATDWFAQHGVREVTVVTQGKNRAAQRLYQRCGFIARDLQLWYHKWYPVPD